MNYKLKTCKNGNLVSNSGQVRSDVHSPAKFRVLGPLANIPEFHTAFGIKQGDSMWRPDSLMVKIW